MRQLLLLAAVALAAVLLSIVSERAATPKTEAHLGAQISTHRGFDSCNRMTVEDLQAFWNNAYWLWTVGIYIGGETAQAVPCYLPDASWVAQVRNQGWGLVFIWDGLQAPCELGYTYRMSWDPNVAYNQGVSAADQAFDRVTALGVDETPSIEYLDIEHYDSNNAGCRDAVNAYIRGWAERLAARGDRSGVYSTSVGGIRGLLLGQCWLTRCPDNVWMANWDMRSTVWGDPYVDDGSWYYHQRLHQYQGDHVECYGGRCLIIDSDCNLGQVAGGLEAHDPATDYTNPPTTASINVAAAQGLVSLRCKTPDRGGEIDDAARFGTRFLPSWSMPHGERRSG